MKNQPKRIAGIVHNVLSGKELSVEEAVTLLECNEKKELQLLFTAADSLRKSLCGNVVTYVKNLNINFTNICRNNCLFCAFQASANKNKPYLLSNEQIVQKVKEATKDGITEVCLQGGITSKMNLRDYGKILSTIKKLYPEVHLHAFSPMEIKYMSDSSNKSVDYVLAFLREKGLGSLPGTAAEILDDNIRWKICSNKLLTNEWVNIISQAHRQGIKTTATIMFGHIETIEHRAKHLKIVRDIQKETQGITEFIPLPFIPYNTQLGKKHKIQLIPTLETFKVMAVSRLFFAGYISNIQVSWPKLGPANALKSLQTGINDFGGTLGEELISSSAGANFGKYLTEEEIRFLITKSGRIPRERDTLYNLKKKAVC